ncbi:MAG: heavy metal translocating P-type ATPase [Phycisphaera sp.]|nr:heavy metal translocating P-type ATPase [Phycisphaera sp.]
MPPDPAENRPFWKRHFDLVTAVVGGVFLIAGAITHYLDGPQPFRLGMLAVAYLLCGWGTALDTLHVLRQFKFDIDVLMFAAAIGAASLGHYEEGGLLLLLFALGGAGERLALDKARGAISALSKVLPDTAILIDPSSPQGEREVPANRLGPGDRVRVRPGQRVPCDGRITEGASALDEAALTGESMPVGKTVGDEVFAGSINQDGLITVEALKPAHQTTLAKVIRLVEEAQQSKSPTQQFTDKVEKVYVPFVIVTTLLLIVVPPLLHIEPMRDHDNDWQGWFYQAMAFLTAASPCALAIGTPASVLSGIARAARVGVLIKGGIHLENLGRIRAIAFDKTGTLTLGKHTVTDIMALNSQLDQSGVLALAAGVERGSQHPLARAIVREAEQQNTQAIEPTAIEQHRGLGITGQIHGSTVWVGKPALRNGRHTAHIDDAQQRIDTLESQGKTAMVVGRDDEALGVIALADAVSESASSVVESLHRMGIRRTLMLTGDNPRTAQAVAQHVGIDEAHANLLPQDKLDRIRQIEASGTPLAMVGDGVNDAPALAAATVGIAIGGAGSGTDVALETADIALLGGQITRLPEAVGLSRYSRKIITQNLVIALGTIAVLAPLAALGRTPISAAVFFHEGSTVLVVLNALRILAWSPGRSS